MGGREIMNSRAHGSEDALAERACGQTGGRSKPQILVGGLGLGFTAAATTCSGSGREVGWWWSNWFRP